MPILRGYHGRFEDLTHRVDKLAEKVDESVALAPQFEAHVRECDRRYATLDTVNAARHVENSKRMDRQDGQLNKILWTALSAAFVLLGLLVHTVLQGISSGSLHIPP